MSSATPTEPPLPDEIAVGEVGRRRRPEVGSGPGRARTFGRTLVAANYSTLMYLYYEVFVQQVYAFDTAGAKAGITASTASRSSRYVSSWSTARVNEIRRSWCPT